jgi:hypothetical protein
MEESLFAEPLLSYRCRSLATGLHAIIFTKENRSEVDVEGKKEEIKERRSRDSSVGIATGYGLDDRGVGVRVPVVSRIFYSPRCPDWLLGQPNLLSNGYRRLFTRG